MKLILLAPIKSEARILSIGRHGSVAYPDALNITQTEMDSNNVFSKFISRHFSRNVNITITKL